MKNIKKESNKIPLKTLENEVIEVVGRDAVKDRYKIIGQECNFERFLQTDRVSVPFIDEDYDYPFNFKK